MAVGGEYGLTVCQAIYMLHQVLYLGSELIGQTVACCIRYIYYGGACLYCGLGHACQVFIIGTSGILGVELHLTALGGCIFYGCHGSFQDLLTGAVEFVADVLVAGTYSGVNPF